MIDDTDLAWFVNVTETHEWTWAFTYAKKAPHWYVVIGTTEGLTLDDYVRAAHVIHTFGTPGQYHGHTNIYLTHNEWKYWTVDRPVSITDLVNRAAKDDIYGPQLNLITDSGVPSPWDGLAAEYDNNRDTSRDAEVRQRILDSFGAYAPRTLDLGCGTGALIDTGVVSAYNYTGVDSSKAMLNRLLFKHPKVRDVRAQRIEDLTDAELRGYELVVVMNVDGVDVDRIRRCATGMVIVP